MTPDRQERGDRLADLVQFVQTITRQVHAAPIDDPQAVQLTQLEGLTMQYIDRHPGVRTTELAADLGLRHSNASAALRELEHKGMIRRVPDPGDRRAAGIWPTAVAERNLVRMRAHWTRLLSSADVGDDALQTAVAVLQTIESALADNAHGPDRGARQLA